MLRAHKKLKTGGLNAGVHFCQSQLLHLMLDLPTKAKVKLYLFSRKNEVTCPDFMNHSNLS